MNIEDQERSGNKSDELSVIELLAKLRSIIKYFRSKWLVILCFSIIGALLGLGYSFYKKPTYSAVCTFVLDDGDKGGGLGQYAGLASLAGINVGAGGGGGIFQGDNIIELYKSRTMIEKALLSEITINGKATKLIDRYIDFNKLRKSWKENNHIDTINFRDSSRKFNRTQDSIITDIADSFNKNFLKVDKLDKKLSIIVVNVTSKDELFSKEFNNKLVETVNDFYLKTKTKKTFQNCQILQHQADSLRQILNISISGVASANDAVPNSNPLFSALRVPSQKKQVDVQSSMAVYGEIVKNLELAKISLRQETPLIQIIDNPVFPLYKEKLGKLKAILIGGLLGCFMTILFLGIKGLFKMLMI